MHQSTYPLLFHHSFIHPSVSSYNMKRSTRSCRKQFVGRYVTDVVTLYIYIQYSSLRWFMDWTKKIQEEIPVPESGNVASHFCSSETVLLLVYMQLCTTSGNPFAEKKIMLTKRLGRLLALSWNSPRFIAMAISCRIIFWCLDDFFGNLTLRVFVEIQRI